MQEEKKEEKKEDTPVGKKDFLKNNKLVIILLIIVIINLAMTQKLLTDKIEIERKLEWLTWREEAAVQIGQLEQLERDFDTRYDELKEYCDTRYYELYDELLYEIDSRL